MILLRTKPLSTDVTDQPISALNTVWIGVPPLTMPLPRLGHLFLVYPLDESRISIAGTVVDRDHYLFLTHDEPYQLVNLRPEDTTSRVLMLGVSPGFVEQMADFLDIPAEFGDLLHAIPLPRGDMLSELLQSLALVTDDPDEADDLFLDIVGQVLQMLRLRHRTLLGLAQYKQTTIIDLMPCMLQARQFIEARYLEPIQTQDVAKHVALSEYHFARLFKSAFDVTVHQYVLRLRLNEARRLLEASDLRVTDIALEVGYNSLSAFIHAFRRYCGMSPSAYINQFRNLKN